MIAAACLGGLANGMILATINAAASQPDQVEVHSFFGVLGLLALYVISFRYMSRQTTIMVESALHRIKIRVGERVARTELEALERVKAAEICDRITENMSFISDRTQMIASIPGSLSLASFAVLYIAWLAPPAFGLIVFICGVGFLLFRFLPKELAATVKQSSQHRITFFELLTDLLSGAKEVKFSHRRKVEIRADVSESLEQLAAASLKSSNLLTDGSLYGEAILFALAVAVVFTLPSYMPIPKASMTGLLAAILFLWGPLMKVLTGMMPYTRASAALAQIDELERRLEVATRSSDSEATVVDPWQGQLCTIEAKQLEYCYTPGAGGEPFGIGPLSFKLSAGEVVFIVGGNGSGKSTLLKVLTGLYAPTGGQLCANGIPVTRQSVEWYRDKISSVFTDFHLFAKLYGINVKDAEVLQLLSRMRLDSQTSYRQRAFTKVQLSTGQRKRLAMIVLLLEDRPFCVFDEWTADQDPEFRRYFYSELLPELRQRGKTIVVVSHDDRYFHCADRVITMEYGQIRSIEDHPTRRETP